MCFSATASFSTSFALLLVGIATLSKVQKRSQIPFASIPMLFSVQQFSEGILWLTLIDRCPLLIQQFAMHTFLFFAYVLWPLWVPVSILLLEHEKQRKKWLYLLLLLGGVVTIYLLEHLILYGAQVQLCNHQVCYTLLGVPEIMGKWFSILYLGATILPFFVSSRKYMWILGTVLGISYAITYYFYYNAFTSVWCFFAALLSVLIYIIFNKTNKL